MPAMSKTTLTRQELRAHRLRLGLSLAQAAEQVHVSPRTWCRWESGERHLPETAAHLFLLVNKIAPPRKKR